MIFTKRKYTLFLIDFILFNLSFLPLFDLNLSFFLYFNMLFLIIESVLYSCSLYEFNISWSYFKVLLSLFLSLFFSSLFLFVFYNLSYLKYFALFFTLLLIFRMLYKYLFVSLFFKRKILFLNLSLESLKIIALHFQNERFAYKLDSLYFSEKISKELLNFLNENFLKKGVALIEGSENLKNYLLFSKVSWLVGEGEFLKEEAFALKLYKDKHNLKITGFSSFIEETEKRILLSSLNKDFILNYVFKENSNLKMFLKRVVDLTLCLISLPLLLPLFLLSALLIKLSSRGPVFYRQERIGYCGMPFWVYKFRSMYNVKVSSKDPIKDFHTNLGDKRITWVGRLIRPLAIDELPQLINVIKGDMSLIGPRPYYSGSFEIYDREISNYYFKYFIKPGLSGWSQINYSRDNTIESIRVRTEYDLFYLKHQSLVFDFKIILKTIILVLFFKE